MKSTVSAIALASVIFATPAFSADLKHDAPGSSDYQPVIGWTGIWIAAEGGALFGNDKLSVDAFDDHGPDHGASLGASIDGLGSSGVFGEASIGFDKQVGRAVVGVFAGVNMDNTEFVAEIHGAHEDESLGADVTFSKKWGGVVGGRLGFLVTPATLLYGEGGYAFGEMEKLKFSASATGMGSVGGEVFPDQETDLSGFFIGGGIESAIGGGLFLRASGRYVKYEDLNLFAFDSGNGDTLSVTEEREELIAKAGIVYKIGVETPRF